MAEPNPVVVAPTQSSWFSKINWAAAVGIITMGLTFFGIEVPADVKSALIGLEGTLALLLTFVFRTWFTKSITTASAKNM
jgi:hypothetical protein